MSYEDFIIDQYKLSQSMPFPTPCYTPLELMKSYNNLVNDPTKLLVNRDKDRYRNTFNRSLVGMRLVNHFHPSIYSARCGDCEYSPYDSWHDVDLRMESIKDRIVYINRLRRNNILQGFIISPKAKRVSVFRPMLARLLINEYLKDIEVIFDPFSTYSGRMLGAIASDKKYVGQDVSIIHVNESRKLADFINENIADIDVSLSCKNIYDSSGTYDALFTSPPYFDKEIWIDVENSDKNCDDWIDECLSRFNCKRYLFVVEDTYKYSSDVVDIVVNYSYFKPSKEYVVLINR